MEFFLGFTDNGFNVFNKSAGGIKKISDLLDACEVKLTDDKGNKIFYFSEDFFKNNPGHDPSMIIGHLAYVDMFEYKYYCLQRHFVDDYGMLECFNLSIKKSIAFDLLPEKNESKPKKAVVCVKCNTPNEYATPNLPDNKYKCYSCRS